MNPHIIDRISGRLNAGYKSLIIFICYAMLTDKIILYRAEARIGLCNIKLIISFVLR